MVKALAGMQNLVFAQAAAADSFLKISLCGFVALHLLRGNHKIEFNRRQLFSRFSKKIIIDIGDDAKSKPAGQSLQRGHRLDERLPAGERCGKRAALFGRNLFAQSAADFPGGLSQHLPVRHIWTGFQLSFNLAVELENLQVGNVAAVVGEDWTQRCQQATFPVDQSAVAVKCDQADGFKGHDSGSQLEDAACPQLSGPRQIYAYLIHFMISGRLGFLPYIRIPTR